MNDESKSDDIFQNIKAGFGEFGKKVGSMMDEMFSGEGMGGEVNIKSDIYETRSQYVIELELPGVQKNEVHIQVHDGILSVKGDKRMADSDEMRRYSKQERKYGSFIRNFQLPIDADLENIKAKYESGILTIRFSRPIDDTEEEDSTEINIE